MKRSVVLTRTTQTLRPSPLYRYTQHRLPLHRNRRTQLFKLYLNQIWCALTPLICIFYVPCFASSSSSSSRSQTRSVSVGVKNQSFHSCCKLSRTSCPLRSKVSTRIVVFHITMVMYIHVYNTVSFSADTVINTTCKPIVESRPGQKKTDLNRTFKGTYLCFCML